MLSFYNLFHRNNEPDLCCAVPEDKPVPAFVEGGAWQYGGVIVDNGATPDGFQPKAAREAAKHSGFYLFQLLQGDRREASAGRPISAGPF